MKNLIYLFVVAFFLTSCVKHEVELIFDKLPEERMAERNAELRSKLVESTTGWKAYLRTSLRGGGYSFYMKFNADETVTMISDWNDAAAVNFQTSTYSIRYVMNTSLIFDTYNYISIMQDPQSSVNGGTQPDGLRSDIEFEYMRSTADSIILRGLKYKNYLYLVKANTDEAAKYAGGSYLTSINNFKTFLSTRKSNYFTVNGKIIDLFFNQGNKTFSALSRYSSDSIVNIAVGFGYALDGASFTDNFIFNGVRFAGIKVKPDNSAVVLDASNNEYPLTAASKPVIDFKDAFAYNNVFKGIIINGQTLPAGVTSSFNSVFTGMVTRFNNTGRNIESVEFRFTSSTAFTVRIWYVATATNTRFLAEPATLNYTYDNDTGTLTLSNYTQGATGNWSTRITEIGAFATWIQSGPFKVDWVTSTDPGIGTLAGLYKVSNPTDFFYGSPVP
jgi:hypothetical protein